MSYQKFRTASLLLILVLVILPDDAAAWPRRRSNSYRYGTSGGQVRVAPKSDSASAGYRPLEVHYNYDLASQEKVAFGDRIRVFLRVRDRQILQADKPIVAEVKISDLTDVEATRVKYIPVTWTDDGQSDSKLAVFDVSNSGDAESLVGPGKVYRLFVNLHVEAPQYDAESALGRVTTPYYVATSGNTRLERARRQVVMRAFKEFYGKEKGWRSSEPYRMDCVAFYRWAAGSCTVGSQGGHANLGRLFGGIAPFRNGSAVAGIATSEAIHGDYVRISGHSFMVLAHDQKRNQTWTIEGNFNHTIEVTVRSANSGWSVGHLADAHIRSDVFALAADPRSVTYRPVSVEDQNPGSF